MSTQIKIFDTTLRDGQQCPGAGMSFQQNIEYARLANEAGVDVLEAGFAAASQMDFMIVKTIAEELAAQPNSPIIASLCQLKETQFICTMQALQPALKTKKARLHTYLPVDPQLMHSSLGDYAKQPEKIIEDVFRLTKMATDAGFEVEFSPEGYSRMADTFSFVTDVIRAAIVGGATIINCPDTVGAACKWQGEEYFVNKMQQHAAIMRQEFPHKNIIWSVHCHNDFGLALDNSMNAVFMGPVTQIEGCFNGVGERAGNVSLEQCIMYIKHFGTLHEREFFTLANTQKLQIISDFVNRYMLPRQPHWPVTGENAAKHSSGGHTNAVIKNPLIYQAFDPKETGAEISLLFGPLSGGNHAKTIIEKFGYLCADEEKSLIAQYIKNFYADRRKGITDQELLQAYLHYRKPIKATDFDYAKAKGQSHLKISGEFFTHHDSYELSYNSNDSALAALHKAVCHFMPSLKIESYNSRSASEGIDALSETKIVVTYENNTFAGVGTDQDIEISALKALSDAVNQAYIHTSHR
ncbi:LeuA family protein [soil metagenome]